MGHLKSSRARAALDNETIFLGAASWLSVSFIDARGFLRVAISVFSAADLYIFLFAEIPRILRALRPFFF